MTRLLVSVRRHGQALAVLIFLTWHLWRDGVSSRMWTAVGFSVIGLAMNLLVMLVNGGMPARVEPDQIPDEERPNYHPITPSTRFAWLSDWIPVGNLLISPGDIILFLAVGILLFGSLIRI